MEVHVEINLPDENGRLQILQIHTNKMKENSFLAADVNLQELGKNAFLNSLWILSRFQLEWGLLPIPTERSCVQHECVACCLRVTILFDIMLKLLGHQRKILGDEWSVDSSTIGTH